MYSIDIVNKVSNKLQTNVYNTIVCQQGYIKMARTEWPTSVLSTNQKKMDCDWLYYKNKRNTWNNYV